MSDSPTIISNYLRSAFQKGLPVLFTGAGFSCAATAAAGGTLPTGGQLRDELWKIAAPGATRDASSLQDIYNLALTTNPKALAEMLRSRLAVDRSKIPGFYESYFSLPWHSIYTINVDDLEEAVASRSELPFSLRPTSATRPGSTAGLTDTPEVIPVVHLNGTMADIPDHVTFTTPQFAKRLVTPDAAYAALGALLLSRPIVYVGTTLDEPSLWYYIEARGWPGRGRLKELRPKSYLVARGIPFAKQKLLEEYNVHWVDMSAEDFAAKVIEPTRGSLLVPGLDARSSLRSWRKAPKQGAHRGHLPTVGELQSQHPSAPSDYLLGQEPIWADILQGRAIVRVVDVDLAKSSQRSLNNEESVLLLVTGTAGSGKSTTLMRLASVLASGHEHAYFVDRERDISTREIATQFLGDKDAKVLLIDDAVRYGASLAEMSARIFRERRGVLIAVGVRAGQVSRLFPTQSVPGAAYREIQMPHLADADIDGLIETLERHHRLGRLAGMSHGERRAAFKEEERAGRQLLVAMIQATSGRKFEEKAVDEFMELSGAERQIYGLIAVAGSQGFSLTVEEILVATGETEVPSMTSLDNLHTRGLLVHPYPELRRQYQIRHREIARVVFEHICAQSWAVDFISALAFSVASLVDRTGPRSARRWRLLKRILANRLLSDVMGVVEARRVYAAVEPLLDWDYHFWLQRGTMEVDTGDLFLAENFLNQAMAHNADDPLVRTEFAHLQLRLAIASPRATTSRGRVTDALAEMQDQIRERGLRDSYPFHVLGSQILAWTRVAMLPPAEARELLEMAIKLVEAGITAHPKTEELLSLREDLKKEYLMTTVA